MIEIIRSQIPIWLQNFQHRGYSKSKYDLAAKFSSSKLLEVKFWLDCKILIIQIILSQITT